MTFVDLIIIAVVGIALLFMGCTGFFVFIVLMANWLDWLERKIVGR